MTKTTEITNAEMDLGFVLNFVTLSKIILLWLPTLILSEECKQTGLCSCETSQGKLDLSPLSSPNPNPRLAVNGTGNFQYHYIPCVDLKFHCGAVSSNVAICQSAGAGSTEAYVIGETKSARFYTDTTTGLPALVYYIYDASLTNNRTSYVILECSSTEKFEFIEEKPPLNYHFKLSSSYACFKPTTNAGISTGSVLVIIFFVLLIVYIIGGVLFMHYVKGAQGVEKFPNLEFWKEIPLLVRDGCLFVFRGCKADTTYSQI